MKAAFLVVILLAILIPQTQAVEEDQSTLWFNGISPWTQNNVLGYRLETSLTGSMLRTPFATMGNFTIGDFIEIDAMIYRVHRNGTVTTLGSYVAEYNFTITDELGDYTGDGNATWILASDKAMQRSSSFYVFFRARQNGGSWKSVTGSTLTTAGLGAFWMNASTWIFHYHVYTATLSGEGSTLWVYLYYGTVAYDMFIDNLQFDYGIEPSGFYSGFIFGGVLFGLVALVAILIVEKKD